ncbi:superoxide dismutase, Ni [Candidatus Woesearchaeota archaeon]|nr:superoxide dismutase, Ni [Candidatus Woesearchaeota archaeon]
MRGLVAAVLRKAEIVVKPTSAYAHCDIPCGIYETNSMTTAADTVYKMVEKILELKGMELEQRNSFVRMVHVKEEHAQKCKQELLILWTDYFKEEHLAKFPDLHTKVWKATKLCSQAKRMVDLKVAQQLKEAVAEIAQIFAATKK